MSPSSLGNSLWQEFVDVLCYHLQGVLEWFTDVDISPVWGFLAMELALFLSLILFAVLKEL